VWLMRALCRGESSLATRRLPSCTSHRTATATSSEKQQTPCWTRRPRLAGWPSHRQARLSQARPPTRLPSCEVCGGRIHQRAVDGTGCVLTPSSYPGPWLQTQLAIALIVGITSFLSFCFFRTRSKVLYMPRTLLKGFSPHEVHSKSSFFGWILPTLRTSEFTVLQIVGLDAVVVRHSGVHFVPADFMQTDKTRCLLKSFSTFSRRPSISSEYVQYWQPLRLFRSTTERTELVKGYLHLRQIQTRTATYSTSSSKEIRITDLLFI